MRSNRERLAAETPMVGTAPVRLIATPWVMPVDREAFRCAAFDGERFDRLSDETADAFVRRLKDEVLRLRALPANARVFWCDLSEFDL